MEELKNKFLQMFGETSQNKVSLSAAKKKKKRKKRKKNRYIRSLISTVQKYMIKS